MATTYEAIFTTMPARLPYAPPTPLRPVVDGPQIGIVVGPEGEEIYTDEYGRVRVWLTWDRHAERRRGDGQREEHATCWIRVNQGWTGMGWGQVAIPRIGTEVLVAHIDGDCDQPIIIGTARNAMNMPPYKLPENKTRTLIRTNSHKADYNGFNEIRFEDKANEEEIFIHAQKDRTVFVKNNHSQRVQGASAERVDGDSLESIGRIKKLEVGKGYEIIAGPIHNDQKFEDIFDESDSVKNAAYAYETHADRIGSGACGVTISSYDDVDIETYQSVSINSRQNNSLISRVDLLLHAGRNISFRAARNLHAFIKGGMILKFSKSGSITNTRSEIGFSEDGNIRISAKSIYIEAQAEVVINGKHIKLN